MFKRALDLLWEWRTKKKTLLRRHFEKFYMGEIMEPHNVYKIIGFGLLTPHLDIWRIEECTLNKNISFVNLLGYTTTSQLESKIYGLVRASISGQDTNYHIKINDSIFHSYHCLTKKVEGTWMIDDSFLFCPIFVEEKETERRRRPYFLTMILWFSFEL